MQRKILAAAIFALFAILSVPAFAQSTSVVILPNGCGTANFYTNSGYLTVDPQGHLCNSSSGSSSSSPYQATSAGTMQSQLSVTTGAVVTLTVPSGTLCFTVSIRSGGSAINYSTDGATTPVTGATGAGRQLSSGQTVGYCGITLANNFKAIAETATTAIDVEYTK